MSPDPVDPDGRRRGAAQLGRAPRGLRAVAHRCPCGRPDVVETAPRLPDGTPFPTLYYLTCPRAASAASRLESAGLMKEMTERLATDAALAEHYRRAHEAYLAARDAIEPLGTEVTAGGHAGPGEVPARARRALPRRRARASTRSATRRSQQMGAWWEAGPLRRRPGGGAG